MKNLIKITLLALVLVFTGCQKDDPAPVNNTPAVAPAEFGTTQWFKVSEVISRIATVNGRTLSIGIENYDIEGLGNEFTVYSPVNQYGETGRAIIKLLDNGDIEADIIQYNPYVINSPTTGKGLYIRVRY